jgi:hypothetical protein
MSSSLGQGIAPDGAFHNPSPEDAMEGWDKTAILAKRSGGSGVHQCAKKDAPRGGGGLRLVYLSLRLEEDQAQKLE